MFLVSFLSNSGSVLSNDQVVGRVLGLCRRVTTQEVLLAVPPTDFSAVRVLGESTVGRQHATDTLIMTRVTRKGTVRHDVGDSDGVPNDSRVALNTIWALCSRRSLRTCPRTHLCVETLYS